MNIPVKRKLVLTAIVALLLLAFGWIIGTQGPLAPVRVTLAQAAETTLERSLFGIGTLEARRSYAVGPTVAGRVGAVLVDHGERVRAGQLLAEMAPVDMDARVAAGAAAAAAADQRVRAAEAALTEAASRAQLARHSAERYADLRRRNFVSQEAAEARTHEAAATGAARNAAAAALTAARDEARRARSELAGAGMSRAHLRMASPVDGLVTARLAEPGSTVVAGQAVIQVIDPASLWLKVRIDQGHSTGLAVGLPAEIVLRSRRDETFQGQVARVDLLGDAVTEERIAYVSFAAPPDGLAIGELAEVTLRLPAIDKTLAIPAAALHRQGDSRGVWLPADGRARFQPVTIGALSSDGLAEIRQGLAAGDAVVVHSTRALADGSRIKPVAVLK